MTSKDFSRQPIGLIKTKNHNMSIIAINGRISSGKDLTGKIIQCLYYLHKNNIKVLTVLDLLNDKNLDLNLTGWQVKKFADKTTKCFKEITGIDFHSLDRDEKEKARLKYIEFAEKSKEIFGKDVWVNALMSEYKPTNLDENGLITVINDYGIKVSVKPNPILFPEELIYPSWCITDMRYPNEYDAVKSRGGITIRVNRHNHPNDINPNTEHPSETALDQHQFDYEIINDGSIEDLIEKVKQILITEQIINP
jgi:hypothetical protein